MADSEVVPIDRERPAAVTAAQRRLSIGTKLMRAIRLLPGMDPGKGEQDVVGDEIENILLSITCEDLDYLNPPPSDEEARTVADQRTEALRAAKLDEIVDRVAARAQRLGHMIAIGASESFIRPGGYESSLRAAVDELCARIPPAHIEEEPS